MNGKLLALAGGIALLGMASVASAAEPVTLADGQLDQVTAGVVSASASVTGNALVTGNIFLDNFPNVFAVANISATVTPRASGANVTISSNATVGP